MGRKRDLSCGTSKAPLLEDVGDFAGLLQGAGAETLRELVARLVAARPDARRECLEFLQERGLLPAAKESAVDAKKVFALWDELEPDLAELDAYGGGDYDKQDHVAGLLNEVSDILERGNTPHMSRRALLDNLLRYISSNNAGVEDSLYEVAYAACYNDDDLRDLAERLETLDREWPLDHAMRIYRRIGDKEKYLTLRGSHMKYGLDYYDLVMFYWENGEREKALEVASEGMQKATGRMDELGSFLAERALESGDRQAYLEMQFARLMDDLSLKAYRAFRKICGNEEWADYEPRILAALERGHLEDRVQIYMARKEFDRVAELTSKTWYPNDEYEDKYILGVAAKLENKCPDKIMAFYMSGLRELGENRPRAVYARLAKVVMKVRHMWLDVFKTPDKWVEFARKIKAQNQRRPAFQEEFEKVIPGWSEL
ncbi:MAG: hypothetical protein ACM3TT_08990 [Syntrophothermus sp.]